MIRLLCKYDTYVWQDLSYIICWCRWMGLIPYFLDNTLEIRSFSNFEL